MEALNENVKGQQWEKQIMMFSIFHRGGQHLSFANCVEKRTQPIILKPITWKDYLFHVTIVIRIVVQGTFSGSTKPSSIDSWHTNTSQGYNHVPG